VRFSAAKSAHAAFSVFVTPLAQQALSPANALEAMSIAAATNAETVVLIIVNAETGGMQELFNLYSSMI
jgi:hypothetical protein